MSEENGTIVLRFLLNLPTEDPTYVDVAFLNQRQAKRALNAVLGAQGQIVALTNAAEQDVLVRSEHVVAVYPLNEDEDDEEDD